MVVFLGFILLVALTVAYPTHREKLWRKSSEDWILDSVGLGVQGILIPLLQTHLVYRFYHYLLPSQQGCLHLSGMGAFLLNFVVLDYLYYWNHRCLHWSFFWAVHQVHHTLIDLDVLGTSRNTLWSSFLIVYLWLNALFIYLLEDPTGYIAGMSLTCVLDLWRHSDFNLSSRSWIYALVSPWLILPQDHAKHHSLVGNWNFGGNLKVWDKWYGTYGGDLPVEGNLSMAKSNLSLVQKLFYPFS